MELRKDINLLLKYRSVWMGIAILMVVLYHTNFTSELSFITSFFYGGVDIFVFASGIGAYYSLSKDGDILEFLKRKFVRIYSTYIPFIVPWLVYNVLYNSFTIKEIIGNIFLVSSFTGQRQFNWYLGFLVRIYILSPILVDIINKIDNKKFVALISGLFVASIPSWGQMVF